MIRNVIAKKSNNVITYNVLFVCCFYKTQELLPSIVPYQFIFTYLLKWNLPKNAWLRLRVHGIAQRPMRSGVRRIFGGGHKK